MRDFLSKRMVVALGLDMVELVRSNDLVYLSWVQAQLAADGIDCFMTDEFTSVIEGSIGAIPRRLLVEGEDLPRAKRLLREAEAALGQD